MGDTLHTGAQKNRRVALWASSVVIAMTGLTFASVPLYRMFCQATGLGGTVQRASTVPTATVDRYVTVRFDANTAKTLGWAFAPSQSSLRVKLGEQVWAYYHAKNLTDHDTVGSAIFNVSPDAAGAFFNKLQCFCFTEQKLKAGESAEMPVLFFIDPKMVDDADAKGVSEITLSYTFYPAVSNTAAKAGVTETKLSN